MQVTHLCQPLLTSVSHYWHSSCIAFHAVCVSPESGAGTVHVLQPCQSGNVSLLNMALYPLLDDAWRGPPFVNHSKFQEGFLASAGCRCLRNGHNRSNVGGITEIRHVLGGFQTGNLANSIDYSNHPIMRVQGSPRGSCKKGMIAGGSAGLHPENVCGPRLPDSYGENAEQKFLSKYLVRSSST